MNGLVMLDVATVFLDCESSRERDADTTAADLGFSLVVQPCSGYTPMTMDLSERLREN